MRKSDTITTGGKTFRVTQLGALQGRKVFLRLIKILGPVLSAAQGAENPEQATSALLGTIGDHVSEDDFEFLCDVFAASTEVLGDTPGKAVDLKDVFDVVFIGNYKAMLEWLAFAVKLNYESFFTDSAGTAGQPA